MPVVSSQDLDALQEQTEKLCGEMADAAEKASIPDETFRQILYEEMQAMCVKMRERLFPPNAPHE